MVSSTLPGMLEFAVDAAWQAGRITLAHFQTALVPENKADNSPVTIADRATEQKLRDLIGRYWPDHGVLGEEYGSQPGSSNYTWILDPIDGTRSFIHGVPLYAVLLALVDGEGRPPVLGVAHFPALNETLFAARGEGCYWNGRRVHVSAVAKLAEAALVASELDTFAPHGRAEAWEQLIANTGIQRTWGDAYGYALVATGRAEIMVDPVMAVWDCGPHQVILEEAGGTFTDWHGRPTIYAGESIATNGALFDQVMRLIR
ncbi:MAG TPA: inositol monophosphatase family protein [Anaerolineae bacterium]